MKFRQNFEVTKRTFFLVVLIFGLLLPVANGFSFNTFKGDYSNSLNTQANGTSEDSVLWKLGKGLPGTGATMQPRLVNFTENGESLIIVGTDEGLAAITLDGFINMSYKTFGPVIDFDIIEDISGDTIDDIILITYYKDHPNLIAIASNNGTELWKFKPTIEGISTETFETQEFITYTWDLEIINDIDGDSISEIVIASWYRIFVVNGKSGSKVWMRDGDFDNDVWKLAVLEDINNNVYDTIIAGSESGKLCAFDSESGRKIWTFKVDGMKLSVMTITGISTEVIPNSIDDIKVIKDVDNDEIDDILIAADDGSLRLISGDLGVELDNVVCYNITKPTETSYDLTDSPYTSAKRLFTKSGVKIYEIPDIDNDGISEYMSIACDLDYTYVEDQIIEGRIFHINPEFEFQRINITHSLNWTYQRFYQGSYPEIMKSGSDIQIYFYLYSTDDWWSDVKAQINCYNIYDKKSENPTVVYSDPDEYSSSSESSATQTEHYFLNVGDVNSDGFDDLFAISANGRYLCFDITNNNTLWVRSRKDFELELTEIKDLNSDGFNDFLIKQISDFEPDWIVSESYSWDEEPPEGLKIISDLFTIDGKTGTVIWSFKTPSPQYYEGLRDLKNVGDITNDGIDDYVGWIIPSTIPSDISEIIEALTGEEAIEYNEYGGRVYEDLYRTLLSKYTKLLAISGSNGTIIWNTPMIDFPYKFYRQFDYNGTYIDPSVVYNTGGNYFNRIDGEIPDSWNPYGYLSWDNDWDISTLLHPSDIEIIYGTESGNLFDLWGDQGNDYIITSYNSSDYSESLKIGTTSDSSSIGTIEREDDLFYVLNSESSNGEQQIKVELSFNQSQPIDSDLQYIRIDYNGFVLDDLIDQIDVSIYNFSSMETNKWKKISTDIINDTESSNIVWTLNNTNELTFGSNNLVKIKLEAKNSSAFTVSIDELVVNYIYTIANYTISAEQDIGDSWNTLLELTIPTDFSDDKLLGVMEYQLSQIERFSALKLQTELTVNTTDLNWYNFTYEIYDASNDQWVLCNWSDTPTWNNHTYRDLQGGYDSDTRIDFRNFEFAKDDYRYDDMWLVTRGTYDGTEDDYPYLEFDYENKTTLSNFINSNKEIRIRLNITNGKDPFNLTIDNFGIGAFYWGLFSNQYDRNYIWDYNDANFITDNLLNLEIQDFDVVNGTNDKYLDVIATIGIEDVYGSGVPEDEWSTRICLFDIKNKETYTKWSLNKTYIPYQNVRILPLNNSLNNWILSGIFQFGNNYNCSHRLISDPHWESQINHFENYSESKVVIDFVWEDIPLIPQEEYSNTIPYEFPGKINVSKDGKIGVILGLYEDSEYEHSEIGYIGGTTLTNIRVIDVNSRNIINKIPTVGLRDLEDIVIGKIDFSLEGAGLGLLISYEDFNNDGFLDHVGFYYPEMWEIEYGSGLELRFYSGKSEDSDPFLLYSNSFEGVEFSSKYLNEFTFPFTSIDDINNDGFPDAIVGIQTRGSDYYGESAVSYSSCKGTYLNFYDIYNSNEYELNELTEYKWILDPFKCLVRYSSPSYEFIFDAERIGDINADNSCEVRISRNYYTETVRYGSRTYIINPITEIIDPINQNVMYRFNMDVDSIHPIVDLNEDGKNELLISSGEIIYCINSKFGVEILSPKDEQKMGSHGFDIDWDTDSEYDFFEVFIDGVSQGPTTAKKIDVSLGSGWRQISIIMHDTSGLILTVSTINVLVPPNEIHLILTFVFLGVIAGVYVVYRRYNKKKEEMVLIDKKIKEGGKKK